jgi:uncharacterized membrane protein YkvA (DUF1232 family)
MVADMAQGGVWRFWGWLKVLKSDALILYYAWKHPLTPAYIKGALVALIAYVFSPVDIVPDFIPFFGMLDDVALIPTAILYLTHMLPAPVLIECQRGSEKWKKRLPVILGVMIFLVAAWITLVILGLGYVLSR